MRLRPLHQWEFCAPCRQWAWLIVGVLSSTLLLHDAFGQAELIVRAQKGSQLDGLLANYSRGNKKAPDSTWSGILSLDSLYPRGRFEKNAGGLGSVYIVSLQDSSAFEALFVNLSSRSDAVYVQANQTYRLDAAATTDPLIDSLAHHPIIGVSGAWSVTKGKSTVVIGLIDTGLDFEHPDIAGQIAVNRLEDLDGDGRLSAADINNVDDDGNGYVDDVWGYDFVDRPETVESGDFRLRDPDPSDDGSGHGTNVAGIIAAAGDNGIGAVGIAPGVRIMPIRAFGRDGRGEDDDIARAIVYGAESGASVLNLSFGDVYVSPLMRDAIRYAVQRGVVVVASAGNNGGDRPHYPSDYPEVISVVWLSEDGTSIASRATHGTGVDIGAPGSSIFTTLMPQVESQASDSELYGRRSGSSMAAPMVAAAAGLLRSIRPELSPESVRSILVATAADIGEPGWDYRSGSGLLKIDAAVRRALPSRVEISSPEGDAGVSTDTVQIRGSVVDPFFASYDLSFVAGNPDAAIVWTPITPPATAQILDGILGDWDISALTEGLYTIRLRAVLRTGKVIEDRRRITIDRSPPRLVIHLLDDGLYAGKNAIVADVETDDVTSVSMEASANGELLGVDSDRESRRHLLTLPDQSLSGGAFNVKITARNVAGQKSSYERTVIVPRYSADTGAYELVATRLPAGFLLNSVTDFDGDGLGEVVLNVYEDGWLGDTLAVYEWNGTYRRAASLLLAAFPRGVGDSDNDGLTELLTQAGPSTIVLEQQPGTYPSTLAFVDTTGFAGTGESLWGATIFDLDDDGTPEIIGHNTREWRILEWDGSTYAERARLGNHTGTTNSQVSENTFEQPQGLAGDLDYDGRPDFLVGDSDGDWILYESAGNDSYSEVWSYETDQYNAGSRLAAGDLDGDGFPEAVTFTHNWLATTSDGLREPDLGTYYILESDADNSLVVRDSVSLPGEISQHGTVGAADVDNDGRDEVLIVNPPDIYLLDFDSDLHWSVAYHASTELPSGFSGARSIKVVGADIDMDGDDEFLIAGMDGRIYLLQTREPLPEVVTPAWIAAYAENESLVHLSWLQSAADSTWIYRGATGEPIDRLTTVFEGQYADSVTVTSDYALRAWRGGKGSALSRLATVRPHAPAVVTAVRFPSQESVEMEFSEQLAADIRASLFRLSSGFVASGALLARDGHAVILDFDHAPSGLDTLTWSGLVDSDGTPVGQDRVAVDFPGADQKTLVVTRWKLASRTRVMLTFSSDVDPRYATDVANYSLAPFGFVTSAAWVPEDPATVDLEIGGTSIGPTGLQTVLTVENMRSSTGEQLAPEGSTIALSGAAGDLDNVYVFPNPLQMSRHEGGLMIAGLPRNSTIQVYAASGELVRELRETDGIGGIRWSLSDESGRPVPSGIYLIRVTADGLGATLKKAAVIN